MANMFLSQSTDTTREIARAAPSIPVGLMHLLHPPAPTPHPTAPQRASTFVHSADTSGLQTFAEASGPSGTPYAPPPFGAQDPDPDILAWLGPYPIRESSRCTDMLAGGIVVQAENVDFEDRRAVVFVFPDLAVRCEGTFVLRYRAGTVYSQGGTPPQSPILAECFSRPFKIYATKEFPGLGPSTKLTKHLWRQGVRVIIRQASGRYSRESVQGSETPDSSGASGAGGGEGDASAPFVPGSTCAVPAHRSGSSASDRNGTRTRTSGRERLTDTGGSLSRGSGEDGGETWG